jgi:hypothetical protein
MPNDRYTKAVLTIIAGALIYIGAMLGGEPTSAQAPPVMDARPQRVVIVGWEPGVRPLPVAVENGQPIAVTVSPSPQQAPVPVTITPAPQQAPMPVTITGIRAGAEWDEVRTKVEQPLTRTPGRP